VVLPIRASNYRGVVLYRILKTILFLAFLAAILVSCTPKNPESNMKQLLQAERKCYVWPQERIDQVNAKYPKGFLKGFDGDSLDQVNQALAGIPDKHLDWLAVANSKTGFSIQNAGGMKGGVTEFGDYPNFIRIGSTDNTIWFALQHEVGHAMTPYFSTHDKDAAKIWNSEIKVQAEREKNNPKIHSYPVSYINGSNPNHKIYLLEYWAEAYNSYYCSPESNADLKQYFAGTWELLNKTSEPPVWDNGSQQDSTPEIPDTSIFVKLGTQYTETSTTMAISVTPKASSVRLCRSFDTVCQAEGQGMATFSEIKLGNSKRKFFQVKGKLNIESSGYVVQALGDNREVLATKTFSIQ